LRTFSSIAASFAAGRFCAAWRVVVPLLPRCSAAVLRDAWFARAVERFADARARPVDKTTILTRQGA
jgi:hypothetical protein